MSVGVVRLHRDDMPCLPSKPLSDLNWFDNSVQPFRCLKLGSMYSFTGPLDAFMPKIRPLSTSEQKSEEKPTPGQEHGQAKPARLDKI